LHRTGPMAATIYC